MNAILTFTSEKASHRPLLVAPYYARVSRDDQRPQIHEYRNSDFITLFNEDLAKNRLKASRDQSWYRVNRLDGARWPQLRQPIHQGYYLATAELACDSKSRAPVDPVRVKEAWIIVAPYGKSFNVSGLEPRQRKLLLQARLAQALEEGTAFPARPQVVADPAGRKHTILAGYLPVADIVSNENKEPLQSEQQLEDGADAMAEKFAPLDYIVTDDEVLWNGTDLVARAGAGSSDVQPRLAALVQLLDENLGLGVVDAALVDAAAVPDSVQEAQIAGLTRWLDSVHFYRIPGDERSIALHAEQQQLKVQRSRLNSNLAPSLPAGATQACNNARNTLRQALQTTAVPSATPRKLGFTRIRHYTPERIAGYTNPWKAYVDTILPLVDRLRIELGRPQNQLAGLSQLRAAVNDFRNTLLSCRSAASALDRQFQPRHKYRGSSLLAWYAGGRGNEDLALQDQLPAEHKLIVPGSWIVEGPEKIRDRWRSLVAAFTAEWEQSSQASLLARDDDQLYQITMLAIVTSDDGCEYLAHGAPGEPFSIASHYETRLMPTYPIKMPTLKDLKKAVRGPAMVMPPDLADEVSKLRFPDGEVEQSGSSGGGIRWIFVFSIPIVTICAMIILMLMINLLNFIFRWIPFAILRIPFPK